MYRQTIVFGVGLTLLSGCGVGPEEAQRGPLPHANLTSAIPASSGLATNPSASLIADASHTPALAWSTDPARSDASLRHLFVDYIGSARRQDLEALRAKHLTPEAAAKLSSCMSAHVDIDEAWTTCVLAGDVQAYVVETRTIDETHGTITYRTIRQGSNTPDTPRSIDALLTSDGPRLLTFNLNGT